jgi:hypothetical protein
MALLYPVEGRPTAILPQQERFTRAELESLLGGTFYYHRDTKQVAVDAWKPYGKLFVLRKDCIMILPINRTIKQHLRFFYWGPIIVSDASELDDALPWYLTCTIWKRGDSD